MRSVIPGIERLSSLVRLGPSCRRHRIVPFQRPSMTRIIASTGHSPTSFFETAIFFSYTDKYDSTLTSDSITPQTRSHGGFHELQTSPAAVRASAERETRRTLR